MYGVIVREEYSLDSLTRTISDRRGNKIQLRDDRKNFYEEVYEYFFMDSPDKAKTQK